MKLLEKVIIAILSTVIFSLALALIEYAPVAEQDPNTWYSSFNGLFILYGIYSFPIYLIGGVAYSYLADLFMAKNKHYPKVRKYVMECVVYIIGGLLVAGILLIAILLFNGSIADLLLFKLFVIAALAALLYYHVSLITRELIFRRG